MIYRTLNAYRVRIYLRLNAARLLLHTFTNDYAATRLISTP